MDTATITKAFRYLDGCRDQGHINMWGAGPYLAAHLFTVPAADIDKLHTTWISSFEATGSTELEPRIEWAAGQLGATDFKRHQRAQTASAT
jgi:hypothetical protein